MSYDAVSRARRIAGSAADAWYQTQGGSDFDTATGVVAALALAGTSLGLAEGDHERDLFVTSLAEEIPGGTDDFIVEGLSEVWARFWMIRPDLARLARPFDWWLNEEPGKRSSSLPHAAASVARAAVKAGLLDMALNGSLADCDLIGTMHMHDRSSSARQARGEFYTPPNLCDMMAQMILGKEDLKPGMSIAEPAAGTGGMLRSAANWIREQGMDPGEFWWVANDISHVSVAGLAVNCYLWGLGPHVIIGVANSLADPEWPQRAWKEQQQVIEHRDEIAAQLRTRLAVDRVMALLKGELDEMPAQVPEPAPKPRLPLPTGPPVQLSLFDSAQPSLFGNAAASTGQTGTAPSKTAEAGQGTPDSLEAAAGLRGQPPARPPDFRETRAKAVSRRRSARRTTSQPTLDFDESPAAETGGKNQGRRNGIRRAGGASGGGQARRSGVSR